MSELQQEQMATKLGTVINRRRNYQYKLIDFVCAYVPTIKCKKKIDQLRKSDMYKEGVEKFKTEID
jgi:hypothetical protein